jgi:hypothetical protein
MVGCVKWKSKKFGHHLFQSPSNTPPLSGSNQFFSIAKKGGLSNVFGKKPQRIFFHYVKIFGHCMVGNIKFSTTIGLAIEIHFRSIFIMGATQVLIKFSYICFDGRMKVDTDTTLDAKWLHHVDFDNLELRRVS